MLLSYLLITIVSVVPSKAWRALPLARQERMSSEVLVSHNSPPPLSLHVSRPQFGDEKLLREPGALGIVHAWNVRSRLRRWRHRRRWRGREREQKGVAEKGKLAEEGKNAEKGKLAELAAKVAPYLPRSDVVEARPDAYSELRMLRFLRKDKDRDPEVSGTANANDLAHS